MPQIDFLRISTAGNFGQAVYEPGGACGPRVQTWYQLVGVREGSARMATDLRTVELEAGEIGLLLPGHREHITFAPEEPTRHNYCHGDVAALGEEIGYALRNAPPKVKLTPKMQALFDLAESTSAINRAGELLLNQLVLSVFLAYLDEAASHGEGAEPLPEPVRIALGQIAQHATEPLTVNELGRRAGISPNHLIRLFQKHLGDTPSRMLWQRRVQMAERLLLDTGLSIGQVAAAAGFQNPYHFSRVFKEHAGLSPRAFRRKVWAGKG